MAERSEPPPAALFPGLIVGDFVLEERLGEGGFGEVFRARRRPGVRARADEPPVVAIKLARDPSRFETIAREAVILERLRHPGIVRLHRVCAHESPPHIVLDHVVGRDLGHVLAGREGRALSWRQALPMMRQVADALAHAHAKGIVHGDVKPANVIVAAAGDAILTDFGLAQTGLDLERSAALDLSLSQDASASLRGTLAYMAPECKRGARPTPASDVYSLGVLLFEMLVGRKPRGAWRPLAELNVESWPALDLLVRRCLDPLPARRPADGAALAVELVGARTGTFGRDAPTASLQMAIQRTCPEDGAPLHTATVGDCVLDRCRRCGGTWFDPGELAQVCAHVAGGPRPSTTASLGGGSAGSCPVCARGLQAELLRIARSPEDRGPPAEVGRVARCDIDGLWLPAGTRERLLAALAGQPLGPAPRAGEGDVPVVMPAEARGGGDPLGPIARATRGMAGIDVERDGDVLRLRPVLVGGDGNEIAGGLLGGALCVLALGVSKGSPFAVAIASTLAFAAWIAHGGLFPGRARGIGLRSDARLLTPSRVVPRPLDELQRVELACKVTPLGVRIVQIRLVWPTGRADELEVARGVPLSILSERLTQARRLADAIADLAGPGVDCEDTTLPSDPARDRHDARL